MIELSVKVSNSESKLTKKFLLYDDNITLNANDNKLKAYIDQAVRDFEHSGKVDDVVLIAKMTV